MVSKKFSFSTIFFFTCFVIFTNGALANYSKPLVVNTDSSILFAQKGNKVKQYKVKDFLVVQYNNSSKFSGRLYKITTDSIYLEKRKKSATMVIAIKDIKAIRKVEKFQKTLPIAILSIVVLLSLGLAFSNSNPKLGDGFSILAVVAFFTYVPVWLLVTLFSYIQKTSVDKGWKFYGQIKNSITQ